MGTRTHIACGAAKTRPRGVRRACAPRARRERERGSGARESRALTYPRGLILCIVSYDQWLTPAFFCLVGLVQLLDRFALPGAVASMDGTTVATRRSSRLPAAQSAPPGGPADATAAGMAAAAMQARGFPTLSDVLLKPLDPSNIHVLVVGDLGADESTGEPVVDVLRASYRVTHASGDVDALALLRGTITPPVDLILKEHEPPATDGVKFIYRVLKNAALRHIPIVGACASGLRALRRRSRRADAARRRGGSGFHAR